MPRISLWRENHSNDYKYFDNRIRELFTAGGVGISADDLGLGDFEDGGMGIVIEIN